MRVAANEPCPLPEDAMLADVARGLGDAGYWAVIVDADWRNVYGSDDGRLSSGGMLEMAPMLIGEHHFGAANLACAVEDRFGPTTPDLWREIFSNIGGMVLHDTPGGRDELRELVDPSLRDLVDRLRPDDAAVRSYSTGGTGVGGTFDVWHSAVRIRDASGTLRGTVLMSKPAAGMSMLGVMAFEQDPGHLKRMRRVASAGRRPAAILFGDLERSSALARRLSTASYFALGRRIVSAADRCVVAAGGLAGRHVGDGVAAFFPGELFESESAAARACITAATDLRAAMKEAALHSDLAAGDVVMRFGLHWGSMPYLGLITTPARVEVTALGDEVNEAARIESCATGGRTLASKALIEHLNHRDSTALELDPDHIIYNQLADLETTTDKARRDAPGIAVCEL